MTDEFDDIRESVLRVYDYVYGTLALTDIHMTAAAERHSWCQTQAVHIVAELMHQRFSGAVDAGIGRG